jgi:hypothetical protein
MKKIFIRPIGIQAIISILALCLLFFSCIKDQLDKHRIAKIELKPSIATPLISAEINMREFLNYYAELLLEDPDSQLISLVFKLQDVFSQSASEIMKIPDQHFVFPTIVNYLPPQPGEVFIYEYSASGSFTPEDDSQRLDEIHFNEGMLKIIYTSDLDRQSIAIIHSSSLLNRNTGEEFSHVTDLNYALTGNSITETIIDLSDYYLSFNHEDGDNNFVNFNFILEISGGDNALGRDYLFDSDIIIENIFFQKMIGYLGQYSFQLSDTLFFDIFDNASSGGFQLGSESANIELIVRNSFGLPLVLNMDPFAAISNNPPDRVDIYLFGSSNSNEFRILSPGFDQIGNTINTQIQTLSNAAEAMNIKPNYLFFDLNGTANPEMDTTAINFVLDSSRYSMDIITKFDLSGSLEKFTMKDTVRLNFDFPKEIESADFIIVVNNEFPIEFDLQVYFTDEDYKVIDSLICKNILLIEAAQTGSAPDYLVQHPAETIYTISVSKEKAETLSQAESAIIKGVMGTSNAGIVKIYGYYNLFVNVSAIVNTHFEF